MKLLASFGFAAAGVFLAAGCASQQPVSNHWTSRSLGPRLSRAFLSYDAENDGSYREFQWRKKQNINLTLRRHLLNENPHNPFQPEVKGHFDERPPHSLVPRPWNYIHVEGLVIGAILYAAGGVFIPLPIDSLIGTFEEGGTEEFMEGVDQTLRPMGVVTESFLHDAVGVPDQRPGAHPH